MTKNGAIIIFFISAISADKKNDGMSKFYTSPKTQPGKEKRHTPRNKTAYILSGNTEKSLSQRALRG